MAAITLNHLTNGGASGASGSANTASITPTASRFYTAFVRGRGSNPPTDPTITGCGLTWTLVKSVVSGNNYAGLYRAVGTPTTGALTITFGISISTISWTVDEWINVDMTGTNGANGIVQSINSTSGASNSFSMSLAALGNANNMAIGYLGQLNTISTLTLGSGYTLIAGGSFDGDDSWITEYQANTTTVNATSNNSAAWEGVAAELKFALPTNNLFFAGL